MITFDQTLPTVCEVLKTYRDQVVCLPWLVINRDLNGRVRLIAPEQSCEDEAQRADIEHLCQQLYASLAPHAYPLDAGVLYEPDREPVCRGAAHFMLEGFANIWVVDRLATEANWTHIAPKSTGAPRLVFFSIKGGVGRSTALAVTAWRLAQAGKRVLVLDLDLESPGLSSALLPAERLPMYGITDWLVEDLVNNGKHIFENMVATSNLARDGEIYVVPAHGKQHGEYIAKLGRVWMPKRAMNGMHETWAARLERLLQALEQQCRPDVVLIDSRSGIDEIASACITELGASLILLFALEGEQTWNGYRMLFEQWLQAGVAEQIRERLQIISALTPELERVDYLIELREHSYALFLDALYDQIPPGSAQYVEDNKWQVGVLPEGWSFDEADDGAPHSPWSVNWHRGFAGLRSLHGRLVGIDHQEVQPVFGALLDGILNFIATEDTP